MGPQARGTYFLFSGHRVRSIVLLVRASCTAEQEEDDMKQIVQWPPRSNKIRWLLAGSRDRIALRAGLRLAASISAVFRPAVALSNRATKHVSLALGRA